MTDDALMAWLAGGAPVALPAEEAAAKRRRRYVVEFMTALNPIDEVGTTEEECEAEKARRIYAIHKELNSLSQEEYDAVWLCIDAPSRRAIKAYVELGAKL